MPGLPWRNLKPPENDKEYLALLSFLPLKHYRMFPKFFWFLLQVQRQLHKSEGLIGYALDAQLLRRRFRTLSVWRDSASLTNFVHPLPHSKIMQALAPHMEKTEFVQWKVTSKDIPLTWKDARMRLR